MQFDPDLLVKALSVLASSLSITSSVQKLREAKSLSPAAALGEYRDSDDTPAVDKELLEDDDIIEIVTSMSVIPPKLLRQLEREARDAVSKHAKARAKATTQTEKDRADTEAAQDICNILRAAKKFNKGQLVGLPLGKLWDAYACRD